MDFVTHLPRTLRGHDVLWVIVDRLIKLAHFLAMWMTFTLEEFCRLYIREIVRLHKVPVSIVLNRDSKFTAHFWKSFQQAIRTQLMMNTSFHPQKLDDMLRACVLDLKGSWKKHLSLVELA